MTHYAHCSMLHRKLISAWYYFGFPSVIFFYNTELSALKRFLTHKVWSVVSSRYKYDADCFIFLVVLLTVSMSRQQNNSQPYKSLHYSDYETSPHITPVEVLPEMTKHFCNLPGAVREKC